MKRISIRSRRPYAEVLSIVVDTLASGGVIAFPTETSYGLAADPKNTDAMQRIFRMKGRSWDKSLPLIAADMLQVHAITHLRGVALNIAERYWPGAVTLVLPLRKPSLLSSSMFTDTVAVRIPRYAWARSVARAFGSAITATSANRSGEPSCYSATAVMRAFRHTEDAPDIILDAGVLPRRLPSTIVSVQKGGIHVLRQGRVVVLSQHDASNTSTR